MAVYNCVTGSASSRAFFLERPLGSEMPYPAFVICSLLYWYTFSAFSTGICVGISRAIPDTDAFIVRVANISFMACITRIASLN